MKKNSVLSANALISVFSICKKIGLNQRSSVMVRLLSFVFFLQCTINAFSETVNGAAVRTGHKFTLPLSPLPEGGRIPVDQKRTETGLLLTFSKKGSVFLCETHMCRSKNEPQLSGIRITAKVLCGKVEIQPYFIERKNKKRFSGNWITLPNGVSETDIRLKDSGERYLLGYRLRTLENKTVVELQRVDILTAGNKISDRLLLEIESPTRFGVADVKDIAKLKLRFCNAGNKSHRFQVTGTIRDLYGSSRSFRYDITLKAREIRRESLPGSDTGFGIRYVNYKVSAGEDKSERKGTLKFGIFPRSGTELPAFFKFGVCTHILDPSAVELMQFSGIRLVRSTTPWVDLEPTRGRWNFTTLENKFNLLKDRNIEFWYTLGYPPPWACVNKCKTWAESRNSRPDYEAWRNYVRTIMQRYGTRFLFYEVYNEPDLRGFANFSVEEYAKLLKITFEEARKINRKIRVASGGFATAQPEHNDGKTLQFQKKVLELAPKSFDIHSYHEHGPFDRYPDILDATFLPMRRQYGIKQPWIASETAIDSSHNGDITQAETLFQKLLFAWSRGAFGYVWYDLRNDGYDPEDGECNFGLITRDFQPKYVLGVYAALTRIYRQAHFKKDCSIPAQYYLLNFMTPDSALFAYWTHQNYSQKALFGVHSSGLKKAVNYDLNGNASPAAVLQDRALFVPDSHGGTLSLIPGNDLETPVCLAELKMPSYGIPGVPVTGKIHLFNPDSTVMNVELICRQAKWSEKILLEGKSKKTVSFRYTFPAVMKKTEMLTVDWKCGKITQQLSVPLKPAVVVPAFAPPQKPLFFLIHPHQFVSYWKNDPATAHRLWKGTNDLWAQVYLTYTKTHLNLTVDVKDDVHCGTSNPLSLWNGDSVQAAFEFPGQKGFWVIGAGSDQNGKMLSGVWAVPPGYKANDVSKKLKWSLRHSGKSTVYQLSIPYTTLGTDFQKVAASGFRFNVIVNENDGEGRDGYLQLAPGIGMNQTMKDSPVLILAPEKNGGVLLKK